MSGLGRNSLLFLVLIPFVMSVGVDDLDGKLSDPLFSRLPRDSVIVLRVFGDDWGDSLLNGAYTYSPEYGFWNAESAGADFVVGVKEGFLTTVLQVNDLCLFARDLPRNPDQYRVIDYSWWRFVWKYKCFSESGCLKKYCEG